MTSFIDFLSFAANFNRPKSINIFISIPLICSKKTYAKSWKINTIPYVRKIYEQPEPELSCGIFEKF